MSLGALYGDKHTFMHDLESFFWVLFWMCIHFNGPDDAEMVVAKFEKWNFVSMDELFDIKSGIISEEDNFLRLANERFTPYYQPLIDCVNQLRKVVFPDGKRARNPNERLYSQGHYSTQLPLNKLQCQGERTIQLLLAIPFPQLSLRPRNPANPLERDISFTQPDLQMREVLRKGRQDL